MSKKMKNPNLLTLKESREIIKSNLREMKRLEKIVSGIADYNAKSYFNF